MRLSFAICTIHRVAACRPAFGWNRGMVIECHLWGHSRHEWSICGQYLSNLIVINIRHQMSVNFLWKYLCAAAHSQLAPDASRCSCHALIRWCFWNWHTALCSLSPSMVAIIFQLTIPISSITVLTPPVARWLLPGQYQSFNTILMSFSWSNGLQAVLIRHS